MAFFLISSENHFFYTIAFHTELHPCPELIEREMVQAGDLGDDAADGGDGLALGVEDGGGGQAVLLQAIEGIRANRRALAGRENQHITGDGLPLQLVTLFYHDSTLRIDPAIEGDAHGCDQGFALRLARINHATLNVHRSASATTW